jgi:hypothetical protein
MGMLHEIHRNFAMYTLELFQSDRMQSPKDSIVK